MSDFGLLVDYLRGELDPELAATLRGRLAQEATLFAQFERLRKTLSLVRSLPVVSPARFAPPQASPISDFPQVTPRPEFVAGLRREYSVRGWSSLIGRLSPSPNFSASLASEFSLRALCASLPLLAPSAAFVSSLRSQFAARSILASLPQISVRSDFARTLNVEFVVRSLCASLPMLAVSDVFARRVKVALYELAAEAAPVQRKPVGVSALPMIEPSDPFRRRLYSAIRSLARHPMRQRPVRALAEISFNSGRELLERVKRSKSLAFTAGVHVLLIVMALFLTAQNSFVDGSSVETIGLGGAVAPLMDSGTHGSTGGVELPAKRGSVGSPVSESDIEIGRPSAPDNGSESEVPIENKPPAEEVAVPGPRIMPSFGNPPRSADRMRSEFAMFRLRGESRQKKIGYLGSTDLYEVLSKNLQYLHSSQKADGTWEATGPVENEDLRLIQLVEITASGALAFLGDGHSSRRSELAFDGNVKNAIAWLLNQQQADGQIGPADYPIVLCHAIALLALVEEYALTGREDLRQPIRRACRWLSDSRATGEPGAFPYGRNQGPSLMTSVWAYMALSTAQAVHVPDIDAPKERLEELLRWFDRETGKDILLEQADSAIKGDLLPSAAALALTYLPREGTYDIRRGQFAARLERDRPDLTPRSGRDDSACDMRYLFFGSLGQALASPRDGKLNAWEQGFANTLVKHQIKDGPKAGSFELTGYYAGLYGHAYSAAMAALAIENAYRVALLQDDKK